MKQQSKRNYRLGAIFAIGLAAFSASSVAAEGITLTGAMTKLAVANNAQQVPDTAFTLESGETASLRDFKGETLIVNFWAAWCATCRAEMPSLSRLQDSLGEDARVVTIATGPGNNSIGDFMASIGVDNLPLHTDRNQALARAMGVVGLPVTVIITPQGTELGRIAGEAHWDDGSVEALVAQLR